MAASIWVKVKGGKTTLKLPTTGLQDVSDLIEMVKEKAKSLLNNVDLVQLQLYQSETTAEERSRCNCFVVSKFRVKGMCATW